MFLDAQWKWIIEWIFYGIINDPFYEFWILKAEGDSFDGWKGEFEIKKDPGSSSTGGTGIGGREREWLGKELEEKLYRVGRTVNFMRENCKDNVESYQTSSIFLNPKNEKFKHDCFNFKFTDPNFLHSSSTSSSSSNKNSSSNNYFSCENIFDEFRGKVSEIIQFYGTQINSYFLKSIIFDQYKLYSHAFAIKSYLLLGQGDFIHSFLDLVFHDLNKPSSMIYKHDLLGSLETAIKRSNATFHDF